jgi:AbrB family looped-hinge helix DNA binding protein
MQTTRLSSKGQVIIPKAFRALHHWQVGHSFEVVSTPDGILLKPQNPFPITTLEEVAGCLQKHQPTRSADDIDRVMRQKIREQWRDCN